METQTQPKPIPAWLIETEEKLGEDTEFKGEKLPSLIFEEKRSTHFEIDFSEEFQEWEDNVNHCFKAIIPITHEGVKKNWWINKKNPVYKDVIRQGRTGKTKFEIFRTGSKQDTRFTIVEEKSSEKA